jgi:hypothetical protein
MFTHLSDLALRRPSCALPLEVLLGLEISRDLGGLVDRVVGAGLDIEEPARFVVHLDPRVLVGSAWWLMSISSGRESQTCGFDVILHPESSLKE